jgi:hypothetical protein
VINGQPLRVKASARCRPRHGINDVGDLTGMQMELTDALRFGMKRAGRKRSRLS